MTEWISFQKNLPDKNLQQSIQYLFDVELVEGLGAGTRIVVPVNYIHGEVNDWHISFSTYTLNRSMKNCIFHYWMFYPQPNKK